MGKPMHIIANLCKSMQALDFKANFYGLTLASTPRTFEWAKPYEPVELTFNTIQQILYPEFNHSLTF